MNNKWHIVTENPLVIHGTYYQKPRRSWRYLLVMGCALLLAVLSVAAVIAGMIGGW